MHPSKLGAISVTEPNAITTSFSTLNGLLREEPTIAANIRKYQVDCLRIWNQSYEAVDEYFWAPICPREEMATDEALLAMITTFEELGMLTKIGNGNYKITSMASERIVFQYGMS